MPDAVLTLNAGSSSLKFALHEIAGAAEASRAVVRGAIEGIGTAPHFLAHDAAGAMLEERRWPDGAALPHEALLDTLLAWVEAHLCTERLVAVGHRVVHGGDLHAGPALVTPVVLAGLETLSPLAPLHQPHNLAPMRAIAALRPGLPQVACFDTAFHRTMPAVAARLPLPRRFAEEGVRRYGFHGLSYEYIAERLREAAPDLAAGRVVAAHLGNGASLCALRDGRSLDTTMGFTALDGLMMGTRSGSLDPGAVLHLQQRHGLSAAQVEHLLYHESGLRGVSGLSGDMRDLLASDTAAAREAVELFVFRLAREASALAASLGGLDGIVFTAGIGEHAPAIRAAACERLAWLGLVLDPAANARGEMVISAPSSRVRALVIPTNEEAMIARHTLRTLAASRQGEPASA
ncbi:acetate/propionate family kinase [Belnapia sp. T6]|uniref:Acetate kinase n=1 Tax=Belnapia mucosa TaxID=2804532 RepID=A0ABS1V6H3_9PROT|nr:acetate/propionate family kinase [Belnapia mucosa]MBL6456334.1 acetate/propionate family kinase [Belnapia mucosa]